MEPEQIVYREELAAFFFRVADIAQDVAAIRRRLEGGEEEDDAEG